MNFIVINDFILENPKIDPADKLILGYLYGLTSHGKSFFGTSQYLANKLGLNERKTANRIMNMVHYGIIQRSTDGIIVGCSPDKIREWHPKYDMAPNKIPSIPMFEVPPPSPVSQEEVTVNIREEIDKLAEKFGIK